MNRKRCCAWFSMLLFAVTAAAQTTVTTSGGTTNSVPVFTGSSILGNSPITVSGGNVGIGIANPGQPLVVNGDIQSTYSSTVGPALILTNPSKSANGTAAQWDIYNMTGGYGNSLQFWDYDTIGCNTGGMCDPRLTLMDNGDVGIGTTSPSELLTVSGSDGQPATTGSTQNGVLRIQVPDGSNGYGEALDMGMHVGVSGPPSYAWLQATNRGTLAVDYNLSLNPNGGDVGIGTTSPTAKLEVDGGIKLTSGSGGSITFPDGTIQSTAYTGVACGGDYAEAVNVTGNRHSYGPGDLLVLDPKHPGDVLKSAQAYSTMIAGIYSTKPGFVGRRMKGPKGPNEVPMAMVGIVPAHATAGNGPIHVGDLLVSSSIPGYAMKGTDRSRMLGAVVGKAMGNLQSGKGEIEVLVTLQ